MKSKFFRNKLGVFGLIFIAITSVIAILGYWITPDSSPGANDIHLEIALQSPGFKVQFLKRGASSTFQDQSVFATLFNGQEPKFNWVPVAKIEFPERFAVYNKNGLLDWQELDTKDLEEETFLTENVKSQRFYFGTDRYGRDLFSRVVIGARVSLIVGFMSVIITLLIGTVLGLLSGYYGGWIDSSILWLINVIWSLPSLLIAIAISFAFQEKGLYQVFLAIGLSMWVELARIVRGQVLQIKEMEYVQAAKVLGFGDIKILFKHILPNVTGPIIVVCAANFASAILLEAGLSFLGLGVQAPMPSWGSIINEHYSYIVFDAAYLAIIPGLCIMFLVMSFNFMGNALRDSLDVNLE